MQYNIMWTLGTSHLKKFCLVFGSLSSLIALSSQVERAAIFGLIRKTGTQNQVLDNFAKITKGFETLQKGRVGESQTEEMKMSHQAQGFVEKE